MIKIEPKDDYELPEIQQVDPTARELKDDANGNTHFMAYQDPTSTTTHSGSGTFCGGLSRNVTHPSSRANIYPRLGLGSDEDLSQYIMIDITKTKIL